MATPRRTFLTLPTSDWTYQTDEEQHEISAIRKRRDGTKGMKGKYTSRSRPQPSYIW